MDGLSKPSPPYFKGHRFTIQSHIPPEPTLVTRGCCKNSDAAWKERERLHPVERCLRHPPLPGINGSVAVDLEICGILQVGDGHCAQVFMAEILKTSPDFQGLEKGKRLVAKAYDPLYFNDDDGYLNPFLCVDRHDTHEARAYEVLSDLQNHMIPKFYGSFSLGIPVDPSRARTVRLILIEHVPGLSMQAAIPSDYSQPVRQQIMKSVVDFDSLVYERDILLTDLRPSNIILVENGHFDEQRRLIFVDFGGAVFGRIRDDLDIRRPELFLGTYISPLLRWCTAPTLFFDDWIDWDWQSWLEAEYQHTAVTVTEEMRKTYLLDYVPSPTPEQMSK